MLTSIGGGGGGDTTIAIIEDGGHGGGGGGGHGGGGGGGGYDYTPSDHHDHHEHHPEPPKGHWEQKLKWKEEWVKETKTIKKQSHETKWKSVSVPVWQDVEGKTRFLFFFFKLIMTKIRKCFFQNLMNSMIDFRTVPVWKEKRTPQTKIIKHPVSTFKVTPSGHNE